MSLKADEILQIMAKAKELGINVKIDGLEITQATQVQPAAFAPIVKPSEPIPEEIQAKDIVTPMSTFDEMDEELIQYWSTPYYDELVAKREAMAKAAKES